MRTLTALALVASLASAASARPHRQARRPQVDTAWMRDCIAERTGPDGGIAPDVARRACAAEQPDDEVSAAKRALKVARANARVAKARAKARAAIDACETAVVDRCLDLAGDDAHAAEHCTDLALRAEFSTACFAGEGK